MVKRWGMERHKGFLIVGSAVPRFSTGFDWDSQGIIFRSGRLGSTVEIKRIKGPIVSSKDAAEEHGLNLCREWIDNRFVRPPTRRYSTR
jgi:hypothetical protein